VLSSAKNAVQPNLEHTLSRISCVVTSLFFSLFVILPSLCAQVDSAPVSPKPKQVADTASSMDKGPMDETLRQLAQRVAYIPALKGPVRVEIHADQSVTESQLDSWKALLEREFEKHGITLTDDTTAERLRIGIVKTPTQVVFSAAIRVGEKDEVRIVTLLRSEVAALARPAAAIRIDRQMVYESRNRILDASSPWNGPWNGPENGPGNGTQGGMVILEMQNTGMVAIRIGADGTTLQTISMAGANPSPSRYPQAVLTPKEKGAELGLPGKICAFNWDNVAAMNCHATEPADPVEKSATLLTSPCDGRSWSVTTGDSDWTSSEKLELRPVGSSKESNSAASSQFPGPILNVNREQNPGTALVVTRNLQTGNYEVYKITLACGN
jgi:hypothetical protein